MYAWRLLPVEQIETMMSWRPGIHKLDGVILPRTVEYTLSVNLKHLFPIKRKSEVAYAWYDELTRKVRWMTEAWRQGWLPFDEDPRRNDPLTGWQMGLPFPRSDQSPPDDIQWLEEGIQSGREFLSRALQNGHSVPRTGHSRDVLHEIILPPKTLQRYLSDAQILAFISDKNLGIVVVTCDWYKTEVRKFLTLPVFQPFHESFDEFRETTCHALETLARGGLATGHYLPFLRGKKMVKFWEECWIKKDIPKFHGIPKIHKNPWKLRPIVPMHSYVTSQLAIILHHALLPVQRSFSWICESSRTLCSEVAEFNKNIQTSTRLHTGDVTAMYTSITWGRFEIALSSILERDQWFDERSRSWILEACKFLWDNTVFQFESRLLRQIDGIPMGIHCGPIFANLYMAFHERNWLRDKPDDFFYRRYIDDCFALHPSDELVHSLVTDQMMELEITWSDSSYGLPFLDVFFHTHPERAGVCFRPYEKALNHHQYLPWASHHPLSVKKGMIKGELSRIRAICYKQSYFLTWKATFLSRLRLRGWPVSALKSWARQAQWRNFFPSAGLDAKKKNSRIVAVSEYNPVWDQISSTDVWRVMRDNWSRRRPTDQLPRFPTHCLVSKKRTRSLWDCVRSVNRSLLHQEIEEIDIEELSAVLSSSSVGIPYSPL